MADKRDFDRLPSHAVLKKLAARPYDLTKEGALSPRRLADYVCRGEAFNVLYATQRVDDAVVDGLQ